MTLSYAADQVAHACGARPQRPTTPKRFTPGVLAPPLRTAYPTQRYREAYKHGPKPKTDCKRLPPSTTARHPGAAWPPRPCLPLSSACAWLQPEAALPPASKHRRGVGCRQSVSRSTAVMVDVISNHQGASNIHSKLLIQGQKLVVPSGGFVPVGRSGTRAFCPASRRSSPHQVPCEDTGRRRPHRTEQRTNKLDTK